MVGIERQRLLERVLDAFAVARGRQPLAHAAPATARGRRMRPPSRTTPRLVAARAPSTPRPRRSRRRRARRTTRRATVVAGRAAAATTGRHVEHVGRPRRDARRARPRAADRAVGAGAHAERQGRDLAESGIEDGVVDGRERGAAVSDGAWAWCCRARRQSRGSGSIAATTTVPMARERGELAVRMRPSG